jgi:diadenosine tetraphosphate (Ap4A) HIT family hydrolase
MDFKLDTRLLQDCSLLYQSDDISYLLHNNADVLWFILVPHTDAIEFYHLSEARQHRLCAQINRISELIDSHFDYDKINVATIGNVVPQMHMHVVARQRDDAYWPDVVWGQQTRIRHKPDFVEHVRTLLKAA